MKQIFISAKPQFALSCKRNNAIGVWIIMLVFAVFATAKASAATGTGTSGDPILWDMSTDGALTVTSAENGFYYVITGSTTTNGITVESGVTAHITLSGVSITAPRAIDMTGATVDLLLSGNNVLISTTANRAGIEAPAGSTLTIGKASGGTDLNSTLTVSATGASSGAAGIGSGETALAGGNITITGGTVTATGGTGGGAGIGGRASAGGGTISVTGGIVIANGNGGGAGIGAGSGSSAGTTTINGDAIVAASCTPAATITKGVAGSSIAALQVYGSVNLPFDYVIPAGTTLTVGTGATLTVASGKTLTVSAGASIVNNGTIAGEGNIVNNGSITNNAAFNNAGTVTDAGTFNNAAAGTINNTGDFNKTAGTLTNAGTVTNGATFATASGATVVNNNVMTNAAAGTLANSGTITNNKTLSNAGTLNDAGTINNAAAGTINNTGAFNKTAGTLVNDNVVTNAAGGTFANSGTITNNKTLSNAGTFNDAGTLNNAAAGTVTNTGAFNKTAGTLVNAGIVQNNGNIAVASGATVDNNNTVNNNTLGSITNNGAFNNNKTLTNSGTFTEAGTLTNAATGVITNNGTFDENGTLTNLGNINNTSMGTFTVGSSGVINNSKLISNGNVFTNNGAINNSGNINNNENGTLNNNTSINNTGRVYSRKDDATVNGKDAIAPNPLVLEFHRLLITKEVVGFDAPVGAKLTVNLRYKIKNDGTDTLFNVLLVDNFVGEFSHYTSLVKAVSISATCDDASSNCTLQVNPAHTGNNANMFKNNTGYLQPGVTYTINVKYEITPNAMYPDDVIGFSATGTALSPYNDPVDAFSVDGPNFIENTIVGTPTLINITVLTIDGLATRTEAESDKNNMEFLITRRGYKTDATPVTAELAGVTQSGGWFATLAQNPDLNPIKIIDAYVSPLNTIPHTFTGTATGNKLTFAANFASVTETEKRIYLQIDDDNVYEETKEYFTLTITPPSGANNVSVLQGKVTGIINSDEPKPSLMLTDIKGLYTYQEGTAGVDVNQTIVKVQGKLSHPHYLTIGANTLSVPVSIAHGTGANQGNTQAIAADFIAPLTANLQFTNLSTIDSVSFKITQDDLQEETEKFSIKATLPASLSSTGSKLTLDYQIRDDDNRQFQWMEKPPLAPLSKSKVLHKGTNDIDTVVIDFYVIEALYGGVEVLVDMPTGIELIQSSVNNPYVDTKGGTRVNFKYLTTRSPNQLVFVPVSGTSIKVDDRVCFTFARKANCNATAGDNKDKVRIAYNVSGTPLYAVDMPNGKKEQTYSYIVKEGTLLMEVPVGGGILDFTGEADTVKAQTVKVSNIGTGYMESTNLNLTVNFDDRYIVHLKEIKINGADISTFPSGTYVSSNQEKTHTFIFSNAFLQTLGNHDNHLDPGEAITVSYKVVSVDKKTMQDRNISCGLKKESIRAQWACANKNLSVPVEIFREAGRPELTYTTTMPTILKEDGSVNEFTVTLENVGTSSAFNVCFNLSNGASEYTAIDSFKITVNGKTYHNLLPGNAGCGPNGYNFSQLTDPDGYLLGQYIKPNEQAVIYIYTHRKNHDRYTSLEGAEADKLSRVQFTDLWFDYLTYNDECNESNKAGRLDHRLIDGGQTTFPAASAKGVNMIDKSDNPMATKGGEYTLEFGDLYYNFPSTRDWFSEQSVTVSSMSDTVRVGKLVINFFSEFPEMLIPLDPYTDQLVSSSTQLQFTDFSLTNSAKTTSINWGGNAFAPGGTNNRFKVEYSDDGITYSEQTGATVEADLHKYWRITVYNPEAQYLQKNSLMTIKVAGVCGLFTYMHKVHYTVDFVTRSDGDYTGARHEMYKVHTSTTVKCRNEPGMNIKRTYAGRINVMKGDQNNNGLDNGGRIGGGGDGDTTNLTKPDKTGLRLDRAYQNDTILFETQSRLIDHATKTWDRLYISIADKNKWITPDKFIFDRMQVLVYHRDAMSGSYNSPALDKTLAVGDVSLAWDTSHDSTYLTFFYKPETSDFMPGELNPLLGNNDSIVIRSYWVVKPGLGTNAGQLTSSLKFWNYAHDGVRSVPAWKPFLTTPETGYDRLMPIAQMDAYKIFEVDLYNIYRGTHNTNTITYGKLHYTNSKDATLSNYLAIGNGWDNVTSFPYELRQPFYLDSMTFTLPYGYVLAAGGIKYLNIGAGREQAGAAGYKWTVPVSVFQDGVSPTIVGSTKNNWFQDLYNAYTPGLLDQIPDESWNSYPLIPLMITPAAPLGLSGPIHTTITHNSPTGVGRMQQVVSFYLNNTAPNFVVENRPDTIDALNDTVRWQIRVYNQSTTFGETADNCWLYVDGGDDFRPLYVMDKDNNIVGTPDGNGATNLHEGQGYKHKWIRVIDQLTGNPAVAPTYTVVGVYDKLSCQDTFIRVTPWFYGINNTTYPLTHTVDGTPGYYKTHPINYVRDPSDADYDMWLGATDTVYVRNYPASISGEITALSYTPTDPSAPHNGNIYNAYDVILDKVFPVEVKLQSVNIIGLKDVNIDLTLPAGLRFVTDTAYYEWNGTIAKFKPAGITKMEQFDGVDSDNGAGVVKTVNISLKEITGKDSIVGAYNHPDEGERTVYLRFLVRPMCEGFAADSSDIRVQMFANRFCGDPALSSGDTILGERIYLEGFRYYKLEQDLYAPVSQDFAFCDDPSGEDQTRRTLISTLYRWGAGEFQTDSVKIKLPRQFLLDTLNNNIAVRYDTINTYPIDLPDKAPWINDSVPPPISYRVYKDPLSDSTIVSWLVPRLYSAEYMKNLVIQYEIDVALNTTFPLRTYHYEDTIPIYVTSGSEATCNDVIKERILSKQIISLFTHTAQIGLSKEISKIELFPNDKSSFLVTTVYTVRNYSTADVNNIILRDQLYALYKDGNDVLVAIDSFKIAVTDTLGTAWTEANGFTSVEPDSSYLGEGNILQGGTLEGGAVMLVELKYRAMPLNRYTGIKFKNNATIRAENRLYCEVRDTSNWSVRDTSYAKKADYSRPPDNQHTIITDEPDDDPYNGDLDPNNNDVMTPIQFSSIRFRIPVTPPSTSTVPTRTVNEDAGTTWLTVERVGDQNATAAVNLIGLPDRAGGYKFSYFTDQDSLAIVGAATDYANIPCGIDVWRAKVLQDTIPVDGWTPVLDGMGVPIPTMSQRDIDVNIVDDNMYELTESFYLSLSDPSEGVTLLNDTVGIIINYRRNITGNPYPTGTGGSLANEAKPYVFIRAVQDSIKEGTKILGAGHQYGTTPVEFHVKLEHPTFEIAKVIWNSIGGGAMSDPNSGYIEKPDSLLTFTSPNTAGVCSETDTLIKVYLQAIADSIPETAIQAGAQLTEVVGGTASMSHATQPIRAYTMIVDDDIKIDTLRLRTLICKEDNSGEIIIKARGGETYASGGYIFDWTGPDGYANHHYTPDKTDSIRGLAAGTYTVTITDRWSNPTDTSFTIVVDEPYVGLTWVVDSAKDITCHNGLDGHIYMTVSGGWNGAAWPSGNLFEPVPPYEYTWMRQEDGASYGTADSIVNVPYGTYIFAAKDTAGCEIRDTVTLVEPQPIQFVSTELHHVICKEDANGSILVGIQDGNYLSMVGKPKVFNGTDPYLIAWKRLSDDQIISIDWTGSTDNAPVDGTPNYTDISDLKADDYRLIVSDQCETDSADFTVREPLVKLGLSVDSLGRVICKNTATGTIIVSGTGGWGAEKTPPEYLYVWEGPTPDAGVNISAHHDLLAGNYTITIRDELEEGRACETDTTLTLIEPDEELVVSITAFDETYQNGNDGKILTEVTGGIPNCIVDTTYTCGIEPKYFYLWTDVPTLRNKDRYFLEHGVYVLSVTDGWGCVITDSVLISEPLVIDRLPNIFTPNGDGINDIFLPNFHIKVYNRWGLLLYEGSDGWDGRYKGRMMSAGTYYYVLRDEETGKEYKSSVMIQFKGNKD
jgi:gliding motility-associated-like protein